MARAEFDFGALARRGVPLACVVAVEGIARAGALDERGGRLVIDVDLAARRGLSGAVEAVERSCVGVVRHSPRQTRALRGAVLSGATYALFSDAWLVRAEERGARFPPGSKLDDYVPKRMPAAARRAGLKFVREFEADNGIDAALAFEIARDEPGRHQATPTPYEFGYYLAMQGLGHGVSWDDDHPDPGFRVPRVEFYL